MSTVTLPHGDLDTEDAFVAPLSLSFFPASFSASSVHVWVGRWTSREDAASIRAKTPGLVTWRDCEDGSRIYAWHPSELLEDLPGLRSVTVDVEENPKLFQRLVTDAVRRRFLDLGFSDKSHGFVNYSKPSLLAAIPSLESTANQKIGIYPKIVTDVFFTRTAKDALAFGLVVDVLYTTRMDVTAAEWLATGLGDELRGKYVTLVAGTPEAAQHPDVRGVVGRISGIRNDRCVLTDLRDPAFAELPLASVAPEPTRSNLDCYLAARYKQAYRDNEFALTRRLRTLVRPKRRHQLAGAAVDRLQSSPDRGLEIAPGVSVSFRPMVKTTPEVFPTRRLIDPLYSLDRAADKLSRKVDEGIRENGPYDVQTMSRQMFRVLVVAPKRNEGDVKLAINKLLNGVQTPQKIFRGLRKTYRLNLDITYAFADGPGSLVKQYGDAINRALADAPKRTPRFDLAITVLSESHRLLPDEDNPYFQTKALALVADGMPTQAIAIEKLRYADNRLQYVLNTVGLAIYAKLGGTSHVLRMPEVEPGEPTELVFGIGRAVHRATRLGAARETIGFATVFRANGEYLYNDCTPYCDDDNYERALEATIRRSVEQVAAFEQLPDGAPLRLIFHVPRRPGRREERPILNTVGKLPRFNITFALVHVNDDHMLQLFDEENTSPTSRGKPKPEASLLPKRGLSVAIGPRERLVTFIGPDQYRGNGSPSPLRLTLDKRSSFKDIDYLTQRLYLMSFMSARSLNPGTAPVTISYAEQLAQLAGRLRGVQNWSVELIQERLGRKLWFI